MTNGQRLWALIKQLRNLAPSDKIAVVKAEIGQHWLAASTSGEFEWYTFATDLIRWASDPYVRFYLPAYTGAPSVDGPADFDTFTTILHRLSTRDFSGHFDAAAALAMCFHTAHADEAALMNAVLAKHLDCGMAAKSWNKALGAGFIREYECMLAKPVSWPKVKWPSLVQVKYNGMRCQAHVNLADGTVELLSRQGHKIEGYNHLRPLCLDLAARIPNTGGIVLDGELMWARFGQGARAKEEANADFVVYDYVDAATWAQAYRANDARAVGLLHGKQPGPAQQARTAQLAAAIGALNAKFDTVDKWGPGILAADTRMCANRAEVDAFFSEVVALGGEGLMLKDPHSFYTFGRPWAWQKYKPITDLDLKIVRVFPGKGKYEGMAGGIEVAYKGRIVGIGTGFSDEQRADFWANRMKLVGKTAEIQYREITPDGSLLHTNFVRIREDK